MLSFVKNTKRKNRFIFYFSTKIQTKRRNRLINNEKKKNRSRIKKFIKPVIVFDNNWLFLFELINFFSKY